MINKPLSILFFFILSFTATAQQRTDLHGRIMSAGNSVYGVYVINQSTGAEVKTDANGNFSIPAKPGDRLAVYGNYTETREFAISERSFTEKPYLLEVVTKGTELEEVVIDNKVTSEQLGIVPKGQKQYTVAERRLYTARSGMGLDQLINVLSGRMKMLKKAVETERKEQLLEAIDGMVSDDELAKIGVPREQARGFLFYAIEDPQVADAIKSNNPSLLKLLLMQLSEKYIKLQDQHE
ncbi:hypothetical protein ACLI1A_00665 [Flavobacterium sp. RHBU_3]|uniref:hypothetical protein n=1 Tax=Flavobacterium sp. RHBU_3 TaxID=3391184 RepID=UPI00398533DD